jgi:CheY-like chemotaxis protein
MLAPLPASKGVPVASGTVLIIEDDDDIRDSLRLILEDEGYRVLDAPDGVVGLVALEQSAQALVALVDYRMPRMDGIMMLTEVARQPNLAQHAYLLVTANYDQLPPGSGELLRALAVGMVRKPFDLDLLLLAVAQAHNALSRRGASSEVPRSFETPSGELGTSNGCGTK